MWNFLTKRWNKKRCVQFVRTTLMTLPRKDERVFTSSQPMFKYDSCRQFYVGDLYVDFFRSLRADLVKVYLRGELVIEFVDQTHQYRGLLGASSIIVDIRYKDLVAAASR